MAPPLPLRPAQRPGRLDRRGGRAAGLAERHVRQRPAASRQADRGGVLGRPDRCRGAHHPPERGAERTRSRTAVPRLQGGLVPGCHPRPRQRRAGGHGEPAPPQAAAAAERSALSGEPARATRTDRHRGGLHPGPCRDRSCDRGRRRGDRAHGLAPARRHGGGALHHAGRFAAQHLADVELPVARERCRAPLRAAGRAE